MQSPSSRALVPRLIVVASLVLLATAGSALAPADTVRGSVPRASSTADVLGDPALRLLLRAQTEGDLPADRLAPLLRPQGSPRDTTTGATPGAQSVAKMLGRESRLSLLLRFTGRDEDLAAVGFKKTAQIGAIVTGTLPESRLGDLTNVPGVRRVQISQTWRAYPAPVLAAGLSSAASATGATSRQATATTEAIAAPETAGSNALIAIIDTGVDIFHRDFRDGLGNTRIQGLLDLSDPGDIDGDGELDGAGPGGGREYTKQELDDVLDGFALIPPYNQFDTTGHGTHVLSVAAGDHPVVPGAAPGAKLLVVKGTRVDGSLGFESIDVLNALAWIEAKAIALGNVPFVVNLSLGTIFSSHDGTSLEEQAIDSMTGPGIEGKVVVVAAGNSSDNHSPGTTFHHFRDTAHAGLGNDHTLSIPSYTPNPDTGDDMVLLDLWQDAADALRLRVIGPASCGNAEVVAEPGTFSDEATACGNVFIVNLGLINPANSAIESLILIDDFSGIPPAAGEWTIRVEGVTIGGTGVYDGWVIEGPTVGSESPFLKANADNESLIGKPGSAYHAITVGSYVRDIYEDGNDFNCTLPPFPTYERFRRNWFDVNSVCRADNTAILNEISAFSSTGPTRDGRIKPDLVAPGERIEGAVSQDAYPGVAPNSIYQFHGFVDSVEALIKVNTPTDQALGFLQGTSFAAPVVTGLVARFLDGDPSLDAVEVRNLLLLKATSDTFVTANDTRPVPNAIWGHGKVDYPYHISNDNWDPTSLGDTLRISTDFLPPAVEGEYYFAVLDATGGAAPYAWSISSGGLPAGLALIDNTIEGVPDPGTAGPHAVHFDVVDVSTPIPQSATDGFFLQVSAFGPLAVAGPPVEAIVFDDYFFGLSAVGGTPPYSFAISGTGTLPPGLNLDNELDFYFIAGVPTQLGDYPFTLEVTDSTLGTALLSVNLKVRADVGDAWSAIGLEAPPVSYLAFDPTEADSLLAATLDAFGVGQDAIFSSTNEGENWRVISTNSGFSGEVAGLAVDANGAPWALEGEDSPNRLLRFGPLPGLGLGWDDETPPGATTHLSSFTFDGAGGVFAVDEGLTVGESTLRFKPAGAWLMRGALCGGLFTGPATTKLAVHPDDNIRIYAVRNGDIGGNPTSVTCRSTTQGVTWLPAGLPDDGTHLDIAPSTADPDDVVRLVERNGNIDLDRSTDGGASWVTTNIPVPDGDDACCLARSATAPELILVGTATKGLWRSLDSGATFSQMRVRGVRNRAITAVAIDPTDSSRFIVGSDEGTLLTIDGGAIWSIRSAGLVRRPLTGLAVGPLGSNDGPGGVGPEVALALTAETGGPYLSRSNGRRFTRTALPPLAGEPLAHPAISSADDDHLVVADADSVFVSTNGGVSFSESENFTSVDALALSLGDEDVILAAVDNTTVMRSDDFGASWAATTGLGPAAFGAGAASLSWLGPGETDTVYAALGDKGLFASTDAGQTWVADGSFVGLPMAVVASSPVVSDRRVAAEHGAGAKLHFWIGAGPWAIAAGSPTDGVTPLPVLAIAYDRFDENLVYAGTDHPGTAGVEAGIWRSINGGSSWGRLDNVLESLDIVALATHPGVSGVVFAATRESGLFVSLDAGDSWQSTGRYGTVGDLANVTLQDPSDPTGNTLWIGTEGYGVQLSTDGGATFEPRVNGLTELEVTALSIDPDDSQILYAGTRDGLFKTTNSGTAWSELLDVGVGPRPWSISALLQYSHLDSLAKRIWATVDGEGIAYSIDEGVNFETSADGLTSLLLTNLELETHSNGLAKRIWATSMGGSGVSFSDDLGESWTGVGGSGLGNTSVLGFALQSLDALAKRIWATTVNGVYTSEDDGATWTDLSTGLPDGLPVTSVVPDPNNGEVLVSVFAESGGGVFRSGAITGVWEPYSAGLDELRVRKLTRDNGNSPDGPTARTNFFASTTGGGVFRSELRTEPGSAPVITTASLPSPVRVRKPYTGAVAVAGGLAPFTWSISDGELPTGLELDPTTGAITGSPLTPGLYGFSVQVVDSNLRLDTHPYAIEVGDLNVATCTPSTGLRGDIVDVTLNGTFFETTTLSSFGAGLSVMSQTVVDGNTIQAQVRIHTNAPLGFRPVKVRNPSAPEGDGRAHTNLACFEVTLEGANLLYSDGFEQGIGFWSARTPE